MHKIKVLARGPKKVANRGEGSMGTTIGKGKKVKPRGSDSSKVKGKSAKYGGKKFNGRKYEATRRSVFGTGVHK